jgi:hypothetical protein
MAPFIGERTAPVAPKAASWKDFSKKLLMLIVYSFLVRRTRKGYTFNRNK